MSEEKTAFSYESFEVHHDYLQQLSIKENESTLISVIGSIPGMDMPVISNKEHWWGEYGDNGSFITCHGGSCCETYTYNKWEHNKSLMQPKNYYYVPIVHYEKGKDGLTDVATVKVIKMNRSNYNRLANQVASCEEGTLPFFNRDVKATFIKETGKNVWDYIKQERQARWLSDPAMKQSVEEQLAQYVDKLRATLPKKLTEPEFLEAKVKAEVKLAAKLNGAQQQTVQQPQIVQQYPVNQGMPMTPVYPDPNAAPQVVYNTPQPVPQINPVNIVAPQPVAVQPAPQPVPEPVAAQPAPQPMPQPVQQEQVQPAPQPAPEPVAVQPAPQPIQPAPQPIQPAPQPIQPAPQMTTVQTDVSAVSLAFDPANLLK